MTNTVCDRLVVFQNECYEWDNTITHHNDIYVLVLRTTAHWPRTIFKVTVLL